MATWPAKTNYATGDVLTAAQMQDIGNALNSVGSAQYAAGKNKIINGDFAVNQRGFTSTTGDSVYTFDRWRTQVATTAGTTTFSAQTFTAGTAPVSGYEGTNFAQCVTSGVTSSGTSTQVSYAQRIEDVRTFANQTVTFSLWAKANTGTPNIAIRLEQNFGSGGSSSVFALFDVVKTITTSWVRYTFTATVPSISGKTLGASSYLAFRIYFAAGSAVADVSGVGLQDNTFQIWGVQVEAGSIATPFQTATGTLAGELAACQRYYYRVTTGTANKPVATGFEQSATLANVGTQFPVTMRTIPTALEQSGTATDYRIYGAAGVTACSAVPTFNYASTVMAVSQLTVASGLTAGRACFGDLATTAGYLGWSAEL